MYSGKDELVKSMQKGDIKAFNQLFDEFYAPLFYYSRQLVCNDEEAKDIVLTCLYKCWERRELYDGFQHIKSFLYLAVRNAGLNYLKKEQRAASHMQELLSAAESLVLEDDHLALEAEVLKRVYKAIDTLPDKCQQIFRLSYIDGKSVAEIAALMQITPTNVSVQRHRAISLLRIALSDAPLALLYLYLTLMD